METDDRAVLEQVAYLTGRYGNMATEADIERVRTEIANVKTEIANIRGETRTEIEKLRGSFLWIVISAAALIQSLIAAAIKYLPD